MGFSNQERINLNSKVLAAGVKDANEVGQWYESFFSNSFVLKSNKIWTNPDLQTLLDNPAPNLVTAQNNAASYPAIIDDFSDVTDAIRLTAVPGANGSTYVAFSSYGDIGSVHLDNWIQPQLVPRNDGGFAGYPSIGYAIRLFNGDPNSGGTEVFTSSGQTGSGSSATVAWVFDYANGMLLISSDYRASITNPYILGFRYIGSTLDNVSADVGQQQETIPVTFDGQTSFLLSNSPSADGYVQMFVNGLKQEYGSDYINASNIVSYTGSPSLITTDVVEFWYLTNVSGGGDTFSGLAVLDEEALVDGYTQVLNIVGPGLQATQVSSGFVNITLNPDDLNVLVAPTDLYVNAVTGDDTNIGTEEAEPLATIIEAMKRLGAKNGPCTIWLDGTPGETVYTLDAGESNPFGVQRKGTGQLVIRGVGEEITVVDAPVTSVSLDGLTLTLDAVLEEFTLIGYYVYIDGIPVDIITEGNTTDTIPVMGINNWTGFEGNISIGRPGISMSWGSPCHIVGGAAAVMGSGGPAALSILRFHNLILGNNLIFSGELGFSNIVFNSNAYFHSAYIRTEFPDFSFSGTNALVFNGSLLLYHTRPSFDSDSNTPTLFGYFKNLSIEGCSHARYFSNTVDVPGLMLSGWLYGATITNSQVRLVGHHYSNNWQIGAHSVVYFNFSMSGFYNVDQLWDSTLTIDVTPLTEFSGVYSIDSRNSRIRLTQGIPENVAGYINLRDGSSLQYEGAIAADELSIYVEGDDVTSIVFPQASGDVAVVGACTIRRST